MNVSAPGSPPRTQGLAVENLRKTYPGGKVANAGISLEVRPGEVFGLLGPNGAGKTTLVNQIMGLLLPDSGTIHLEGIDLIRHPQAARKLCSYLPQEALPIDSLPAAKAIELMGRIRGGPSAAVRDRTESLLRELEIEEWRSKLGTHLSGGVRRLVGFGMAVVWPGDLVILDEPTNDIDPLRRRLLWRAIRRLAGEGSAILLVTHNVLEAERSVDRLAVMDEGKILAQGTPGALKGGDRDRLRLDLMLEPDVDPPAAPPFAEIRARSGRKVVMHLMEADASQALDWARAMSKAGTAESFELGPASLEDAYLNLIGRSDLIEQEAEHNEHVRAS